MVTGQMIYNWLLMDMFLYTSMIYLSLFIHILVGTRLLIKKGKSKKTPHHLTFPSKTLLFTGLFAREVFSKEVTQHLT